ncbi:hypothetical protein NEIMUCOT_04234 [Neisseria mucosa ATCC 25996]|uniref:Uncharacterized protein n=1 Tax=Neisseria mucosa (strain ATCC 25996 / DSM 4631 / NCTC 10774 / M26) TaxID=546266 RepID=D2ZUE6_NEIM2|nr:hypothetical protein NEIMUCOT_04234 [Neisseria mucosa ATCC 25996]
MSSPDLESKHSTTWAKPTLHTLQSEAGIATPYPPPRWFCLSGKAVCLA